VERVADQERKDRGGGPESGNAEYDRLLHRRKGISGSQFAGIGIQFAVSIVLFAFAGVWLDKRLGTSPIFILLLVLGGGALAFWTMVRKLK
jgi:F0F1-type ATP synthase assembly protein I